MKVGKHEKLAIDKKHVPSHATLVSSTGHVTFVSAWHVDQIRMLVVKKKINSVLRKLAAKNCRVQWRQLRERERIEDDDYIVDKQKTITMDIEHSINIASCQ